MKNLHLSLFPAVLLLLLVSAPSESFASIGSNTVLTPLQSFQDDDTLFYNQVVILKTGERIVGRIEYDEDTDRYSIKTKEGDIRSVLSRDVARIEEYSRTYLPPTYHPTSSFTPCDIRQREEQWYFVEVRLTAMYAGSDDSDPPIGLSTVTIAPELAAGFRLGEHWGLGLGATYFSANDVDRIPVFIHARYQLNLLCLSPFLYAQAGTVFDNQSEDNIAFDKIFHPGPKIAGFGIGLDYALNSWLDLSADLGYRYMQLPTRLPCDCSDVPPLREALFYNESHGVLLRVGVTF